MPLELTKVMRLLRVDDGLGMHIEPLVLLVFREGLC